LNMTPHLHSQVEHRSRLRLRLLPPFSQARASGALIARLWSPRRPPASNKRAESANRVNE
jgi:hypothetical protein